MKKMIVTLLAFWLCMDMVHAESYCVMSGNGEEVYEEKDMHKTQSVASISKIMTAILAIEHGNLEETWKTSPSILESEGSSLYLQVGQSVTMRSLLYGLMLRSGNDAAVEIAQRICGSEEAFVDLMNEKAQELHMENTVFHNSSGLDEEDGGNISSAYDMAILTKYAMQNSTFQEITGSKYYTCEWNLRWKNKNRLLFEYPNTTGGKTGFTKKAGRTLVTTAMQEGMESIVVSLDMQGDFAFHQASHEQVFTSHTPFTLLKAGNYTVDNYQFQVEEDVILALAKEEEKQIKVNTRREKEMLIIEVLFNDQTYTYTYQGEKIEKGGLFT